MKTEAALSGSSAKVEILTEKTRSKQKEPKAPKSSLERLVFNSERITELLMSRKELKNLRFDELELLRDIRDLVEIDPKKFENIKNPVEFRREIRIKILHVVLTLA